MMLHFENENDRINFIIYLALFIGICLGMALSIIGYLVLFRQ